MDKFKEIRTNCFYRLNKRCSYWTDNTQCHLLSCPIFSRIISKKEKNAIKKQVSDSVKFSVRDFDKDNTSAVDLIKKVRSNDLIHQKDLAPVTTIRDPSNTLIYIHSKGKCKPRKDGIPRVRKEWLETHSSNEI
ncbi:MAG: hypothetical protein ACXACU_17190 [Candidatus Hodarchaeales archaeon]|jgi:hypothetical protein